jgi:F-type H+-transporting ATPase subunit b
MIDLNYTLFVQLANFLFLIIAMHFLLLKPILRHMDERDGSIENANLEAADTAKRAELLVADYEAEMAYARGQANQVYQALQQEGMAEARSKVSAAKAEAQQAIEKAMAEVQGEAAKAREILKAEMAKLPGQIASKILGRAV